LNTGASPNSVPQKQIAEGKLYLTKMWNFSAKRRLLANLPVLLKRGADLKDKNTTTVPIRTN
jgi:hypothetical protein